MNDTEAVSWEFLKTSVRDKGMQWAKCFDEQTAQNQWIYRVFKERSVRLGARVFGNGQVCIAVLERDR